MPDELSFLEPTEKEQKEQGESLFYSLATGYKVEPSSFLYNLDGARESYQRQPLKWRERMFKQVALGDVTVKSGARWNQIMRTGGLGKNPENDTEAMSIWEDEKRLQAELGDPDMHLVQRAAELSANMLPFVKEGFFHGAKKGLLVGGYSALGAGVLGSTFLPMLPEEGITMPVAFGAGFRAGMGAGIYEHTAMVESGLLYRDLVHTEYEDGKLIPHEIAATVAGTVGSVNGLIEVLQMSTFAKIPGIRKISGKMTNKIVKRLMRSGALKRLALFHAYRHGVEVTQETLQELSQEVTQLVGQEYARAFSEDIADPTSGISLNDMVKATGRVAEETDWNQIGKHLWDMTPEMLLGMSFLNAPSAMVGGTTDLRKAYKEDPQLQATVERFKEYIRSDTGAVGFTQPPGGNEGMRQLYSNLLEDREQIAKMVGKKSVYSHLRKNGWKGMEVPPEVARVISAFMKAEKARPINTEVEIDAERALSLKGNPNGTEWYRDTGLAPYIKDESPEEALKFFALLAYTSAQTESKANIEKTVKVWQKYKAGIPPEKAIEGALGYGPKYDPRPLVIDLLKSSKPEDTFRIIVDNLGREEGQVKIRNFAETLKLANIDPDALYEFSRSVIDFRMGQYFFGYDKVPIRYDRERAERRIIEVRDYLRENDDEAFWTTERVQAALWNWIKAWRVAQGLEAYNKRENPNFAQAIRFRAARHYEIAESELTDELVEAYIAMNQITTPEGIQVFDHYIIKKSIGDKVDFRYLDPDEQGTGHAGREWKNQIEPGQDRPRIIHVYNYMSDAEKEFWNSVKARVLINNAGKIYDFSNDTLNVLPEFAKLTPKTDAKIIGDLERKIRDAGFFGYRTGNVVVFFSPVKVYPLYGYTFNVSTSITADQYTDAITREDQESIDLLDELENLNSDLQAKKALAVQRAVEKLSHPTFDVIRLDEAEGHFMDTHEFSMDGFAEVGDETIFRGKLARFLQLAGQDYGYYSKVFPSLKKPDELSKEQAPSFVFTFPEKLFDVQFARIHELLIGAGLKAYTYKYEGKSLAIDHLPSEDGFTYNDFVRRIKKFVKALENEQKQPGAFPTKIPMPTYQYVWKKHNIIRKVDYEKEIEKGDKKERDLGIAITNGYVQRGLSEIPGFIRARESLYYPPQQSQLPSEKTEGRSLEWVGWQETGTPGEYLELWNQWDGKGYTTKTRATLEKEGVTVPSPPYAPNRITAKPVRSYSEGMNNRGNVYVKQDPSADNGDRVLLVQVDYHLTTERGGIADDYYDKLYTNRDGYDRGVDFWEIPRWVGISAAIFPNSDFYVIRDIQEAIDFFNRAGYKAIMFSSMDVNKLVIKEVAENYNGEIHTGGYIDPKFYKNNDNVIWHRSPQAAAKALGIEPDPNRKPVDYRHFKDTKVIPRLCMSEGCLHKCAFCIIPKKIKQQTKKSIREQVAGFADLDYKLIYLDDKTFGQAKNYTYLVQLNEMIRRTNPDFQGFIIQTTATQFMQFDDQFLQDSGIKYVELGVETFNDPILKKLHKPHREKHLEQAVEKLRKNHIWFIPNIMVGLAGKNQDGTEWAEDAKTYKKTMSFLKKNKDIISHINVYNLALYEGSELSGQLEASEIDSDENTVARSYHKNPKVHEKFYRNVTDLGIKLLDKGPIKGRAIPTLADPTNLEGLQEGDTLYLHEEDFSKVVLESIGKGINIQILNKDKKEYVNPNKLTRFGKRMWALIEKSRLRDESGGWSNLFKHRVQKLRIAVKDPETEEVYLGAPDEVHVEIIIRINKTRENQGLPRINPSVIESLGSGYYNTQTNQFMNRQEAAEWAADPGSKTRWWRGESTELQQIKRFFRSERGSIPFMREKKKPVKSQVLEATGVKKTEQLTIKETQALKAQIQASARAAQEAFAAGQKAATEKERIKARDKLAKEIEKNREARDKLNQRRRDQVYLRKVIDYFKDVQVKLSNPTKYKIPEEEAAPLRDFFSGIDLVKLTEKKRVSLEATLNHLKGNPEQELPPRVWEQLERLEKKAVRDYTMEEVQAFEKMVRHYMHLASMKKKLIHKRKLVWLNNLKQTAYSEMKSLPDITGEIISSARGAKDKARSTKDFIKNVFGIWSTHYDLLIEAIAGPTSVVYDVLYQQVKEGIRTMQEYRTDVFNRFSEEVAKIAEYYKVTDLKKWLQEPLTSIGVVDKLTGQETTVEFSRGELMSLMRHLANPDNAAALINGGFGLRGSKYKNRVYLFKDQQIPYDLANALGEAEMQIAGALTDTILDEQGNIIAQVYRQKNGIEMDRQRYYWRKDTVASERGEIGEEEAYTLEKFKSKFTRVAIPKGFTIPRVGSKKAIMIGSFESDLSKSIFDAAAYIGLEIPISNASKLLYDQEFKNQFEARYSEDYWKTIDQGLRDIIGEKDAFSEIEDKLLKYRSKFATAVLGLNPWVMLKQVVSLPLYAVYVKPQYLIQALIHGSLPYTRTEQRLKMYSPEYLERVEAGYSRDVAEVFQAAGTLRRLIGGKKTFAEKMMYGIQLFDRLAVVPGMEGAALQVLDEFKNGKLSESVKVALMISERDIPNLTVADKLRLAYRYADFVTERTQPMFAPEHRSHLSRGNTVVKMFTMFSSFTNQAYNLIYRTGKEAKKGNWKPFATTMFVLFVINPMAIMFIDGLRDKLYGRDDDDKPLKGWFWSWLKNIMGYTYFIRDIFNKALTGFEVDTPMTKWANDAGDTLYYGLRAVTDDDKEKREKNAWKFIDRALSTFLTLWKGIPYYTPKRLIESGFKEDEKKRKAF